MSNYDNNNIFAKILRNEVDCKKLLENKHAISFFDINPQAPTHVLIIPKNPYINFYDFNKNASSEEILCFWSLANNIIEMKKLTESGFRIISNSGKNGNQDVPHFHVHILGDKNLGRMIS